jgi:hypothetical protein
LPGLIHCTHNATAALTVGTEATIFVRFNPKIQYPIPGFEMVTGYEQSFQIEQFCISSINRGKGGPHTDSVSKFFKKSLHSTCVPLPDAI